jgi:hypothetical protein
MAVGAEQRGVHDPARIVLGLLVAIVALYWVHPGTAQAETTCYWGGTVANPTGTLTITPGVTNIPAGSPLKFKAWGPVSGDDPRCHGQTMTWVGQLDAGSSCLLASFEGTIKGLEGASTFWGRGNLLVPSHLYDRTGNLVGLENAQIITQDNLPRYNNCNAPAGFTYSNFSSNVVLY